MKPLILLLGAFVISLLLIKFIALGYDYALAGRIAMSAMLLFTAVGHFAFTKGMTMMVPDAVPFKKEMVYATGVLEILAAVGLLIPATREITGWALILLFIVLLPGNIKAAVERIDYQKGSFDGPGLSYLWFRIPLQVLFIVWVYIFSIHS